MAFLRRIIIAIASLHPPAHRTFIMSNISWSTMDSTIPSRSSTTASSTSMSSAGCGASSVQDPVGGLALGDAIGPIATLEERAAALKQCAIQATVIARDATTNAAQMTSAHTTMIAQHRKLFLRAAFGINPDGTAITDQSLLPECLKAYKSVKTVKQYNYIIDILRNWGDDAVLANAHPYDQDAAAVGSFCKKQHHGYNYVKQFKIEEAQSIDGSPKD
jgi:hypothetical protein